MGLLEDVVVNAKEAVNAVGKKAGQMVDISKLRLNAADLNNEISKRFEALGRVIYDSKKTENDSADLVNECITAIDELSNSWMQSTIRFLPYAPELSVKNVELKIPQKPAIAICAAASSTYKNGNF